MSKRNRWGAVCLALSVSLMCKVAAAQGTVSVDLLDPSETSGTIPGHLRIVDIFVDVAATDVWTAGGIRALAVNGASFLYHDGDANQPGTQAALINPGTDARFTTSLSKPRARDANARFENCGAAVAGGFPQFPVTTAGEFNITWFATPPETSTSPSVDGYIARIALDVSAVPGALPGNDAWSIGLAGSAPPDAVVVLSCPPLSPNGTPGTMIATWDMPDIAGVSWEMWFVPEPGSILLLITGGLVLRFQRRNQRSKTS